MGESTYSYGSNYPSTFDPSGHIILIGIVFNSLMVYNKDIMVVRCMLYRTNNNGDYLDGRSHVTIRSRTRFSITTCV